MFEWKKKPFGLKPEVPRAPSADDRTHWSILHSASWSLPPPWFSPQLLQRQNTNKKFARNLRKKSMWERFFLLEKRFRTFQRIPLAAARRSTSSFTTCAFKAASVAAKFPPFAPPFCCSVIMSRAIFDAPSACLITAWLEMISCASYDSFPASDLMMLKKWQYKIKLSMITPCLLRKEMLTLRKMPW